MDQVVSVRMRFHVAGISTATLMAFAKAVIDQVISVKIGFHVAGVSTATLMAFVNNQVISVSMVSYVTVATAALWHLYGYISMAAYCNYIHFRNTHFVSYCTIKTTQYYYTNIDKILCIMKSVMRLLSTCELEFCASFLMPLRIPKLKRTIGTVL